jgi:hypothetical protein
MSATSYLTSPEAFAAARRIEKLGLLDPNFWVQLIPVWMSETCSLNYVLRYYVTEDAEEPIASLHFMESKKLGKSAAFIVQLQEALGGWGWEKFKANFLLVRVLPTLANTRRYKLQLLVA